MKIHQFVHSTLHLTTLTGHERNPFIVQKIPLQKLVQETVSIVSDTIV
jgi:hypothetical protein